ncbi:hypothetical protein RJ640_002037 [Escallonia rubra]|uniref:Cytochrome b5 heme-binding domain-containing protein n=1 Tax=Escallonia rubra TaxID=112253 RepID=A0AA88RCZ7_9ASTE|nr:hypothetical protein RJ640_002037 [Escallonia rubra]
MAILLEHDSPCLVYKGHVQEVYDVTKFLDDHPGGDEGIAMAFTCTSTASPVSRYKPEVYEQELQGRVTPKGECSNVWPKFMS